MTSPLSEYRALTRSLLGRLRQHCALIGINPPLWPMRRYASLRYIESRWWLRAKMTEERADDLEVLANRLRLVDTPVDSPLCLPDVATCVVNQINPARLAPWGDEPLMLSVRDL